MIIDSIIDTSIDRRPIINYLRSISMIIDTSMTKILPSLKEEGIWRWDHSGDIATYFNWHSGQPNGQNYVLLVSLHNYEWHDWSGGVGYTFCQFIPVQS